MVLNDVPALVLGLRGPELFMIDQRGGEHHHNNHHRRHDHVGQPEGQGEMPLELDAAGLLLRLLRGARMRFRQSGTQELLLPASVVVGPDSVVSMARSISLLLAGRPPPPSAPAGACLPPFSAADSGRGSAPAGIFSGMARMSSSSVRSSGSAASREGGSIYSAWAASTWRIHRVRRKSLHTLTAMRLSQARSFRMGECSSGAWRATP